MVLTSTSRFLKWTAILFGGGFALYLLLGAIAAFGGCDDIIIGWGNSPITCTAIPDGVGDIVRVVQLFLELGAYLLGIFLILPLIFFVVQDYRKSRKAPEADNV